MDPWLEAIRWIGMVLLIFLSGSFSGLNLGLMGLDKVGLEIVMAAGDPKERGYAKKILPVRRKGNYLLCTILLGNVAVNSLFSILTADLTNGLMGFLISTLLIVVFGEIVPQAICSRHGLAVGAHYMWMVKFFMIVTAPLAVPVSWLLDKVLGREIGQIYTRKELRKLVDIHQEHHELTTMEKDILHGALDFSSKIVLDVMTPLENVYGLNVETIMNFTTISEVLEIGHSRVPVWENKPSNIIAVLFVRDLVLINPDDEIPLRKLLSFLSRPIVNVFYDIPLDKLFTEFKGGESHMALVQRVNSEGPGDPFYENLGVVTLEDVIEELVGDEILDETDMYIDNAKAELAPIRRRNAIKEFVAWKRSRFRQHLTEEQAIAVKKFLRDNVAPFSADSIPSETVFNKLLEHAKIEEIPFTADANAPTLYTRGKHSNIFTLVLQGKLDILSGEEGFRSEVGSFAYLGLGALSSESNFVPDFTATAIPPNVQVWQITRDQWDVARKAASYVPSEEKEAESKGTILRHIEHSDTGLSMEFSIPESSKEQQIDIDTDIEMVLVEKPG